MAITISGSGIVEANLADNAVTLAKMASGTDGQIITYDASGDPAAVGPGTDGQVLTSTGSTTPPAFEAAGGGLYASVAIIADQKAANTAGGTFTSGAWRTRDLQTEVNDPDGIVSITSNQFTLDTGTYTIEWSAPAYNVGQHQSALWNGSYLTYSDIKYNGVNVDHTSLGWYVVTIGSSTAFEIRHKCQNTNTTQGFGVGNQLVGLGNSTFTRIKILKHA